MHSYLIFILFCLNSSGVFGDCSCSQDPTTNPIRQTCTGDRQVFIGDTEIYAGEWITCTTTLFTSSFTLTPYYSDQIIRVDALGILQIQGDFIIPPTSHNTTISIIEYFSDGESGIQSNATLEVIGNLTVDGLLNIDVANVVIYGNILVSSTGQLIVNAGNMLFINGSITTENNITIIGKTKTTLTVGGSIHALSGAQSIYIASLKGNITGDINALNSDFIIGALTTTSINTRSLSLRSVDLVMLPVDQGQSNFGIKFLIFNTTSPINFPVVFTQNWECGSYNVTPTISTLQGISITLWAPALNITSSQYCCFEGIDPCVCAPYSGKPIPVDCIPVCQGWICDTTGFIVGWVIGGALALTLLSRSCQLLVRDFNESVA